MSVPAGLMQALQQGGGMGGPPGADPAGATSAPPDSSTQSDGDWETDLHNAIAALHELLGDAEDNQEGAVISQCITQLRKLTAQRQSGAESALGVTPAHKAMKRSGGY